MPSNRREISPIFHLGLHKTGTSYLQRRYFVADHGYIPVPPREIIDAFVDLDGISGVNEECLEKISLRREQISDDQRLILSHERLSGYPFADSYDRAIIIGRVIEAFPSAKVIVIFREQKSQIYSFWKQSISDGSGTSLQCFLNGERHHTRRMPVFALDTFNYESYYSFLVKKIGSENLLFLPYELCVEDMTAFLHEIRIFTHGEGIDAIPKNDVVNASKSSLHLWVLRMLNRYVYRTQLSPNGIVSSNSSKGLSSYGRVRRNLRRLDKYKVLDKRAKRDKLLIKKHVSDHYEVSNKALAEKLGRDLERYGYY